MGHYSNLALLIAEAGPSEHSESWENFGARSPAPRTIKPAPIKAELTQSTTLRMTCRKCGDTVTIPTTDKATKEQFEYEHYYHGMEYHIN
jgi:hypothetical protein